ncbi:TIGR01777 family oxidoreductase [Flavobacterium undicola]|uniref:TIGR01777 family oxidoreductase n=1 Tax=Flavobacterium undicola TaxID=1932779 RepID=UPI0013780264|nr:TIGR01777 family oxidoreductase [Flavobacterium undicola]MBA0883196.1 TIGR01777 family protein [Flavobacterium undicola]
MKKNVLITGGTGFVGRHLTDLLVANGFSVSILSRSKRANTENIFYYTWDVEKQFIEEEAIQKADYVIHLAGANIGEKRWTNKRKEEIVSSRELSAQLIYNSLVKYNKNLEAFVSASAVGIYGAMNGRAICNEEMQPANDFLGLTCQKWEAAANQFEKQGIRTVKIRTGLVLGKEDGFLKKLVPIFKLRLGSALGTGKQYMPWIHIDDLCRIYLEALKNPLMKGAYNAAITDDTTNELFSKTLAKLYGYAMWLPNVPSFLIKIALGEMAKLALTGRRVSSKKITKLGFRFQFQKLEEALKYCISDE